MPEVAETVGADAIAPPLGRRYWAAIGIGAVAAAVGGSLVSVAFFYSFTYWCSTTVDCVQPAELDINGAVWLIGVLLLFLGLGFTFAVLLSSSGRWRER